MTQLLIVVVRQLQGTQYFFQKVRKQRQGSQKMTSSVIFYYLYKVIVKLLTVFCLPIIVALIDRNNKAFL